MGSATAQTICSGSTTNIALNSTVIGSTYMDGSHKLLQQPVQLPDLTMVLKIQLSLSNTRTTAGIRYTVLQILVQEHLLQLMLPLI
jgi:hypothetical protein